MASKIKVKLVRSKSGAPPNVRECLRGLGLRRINSERELVDTPSVRGLIFKVKHLIEVDPPEAAMKTEKA